MRVRWTGPVMPVYLMGQRQHLRFQTCYRWYVDLLVSPWSLVLWRECLAVVFCFLLKYALFSSIL